MVNKKNRMVFSKKNPFVLAEKGVNKVFNFQNFYSVWLFENNDLFNKQISKKNNLIFPDSKNLARLLRVNQQRGPSFTRNFLTSEFAKNKKHFFIGNSATGKEISEATGVSEKNIHFHNVPFFPEGKFEVSEKGRADIIKNLKKQKPDYIWVCVGNPRQEILANRLYDIFPGTYFTIGAALGFLTGKKAEAPEFWRSLGLEWFYRLITDFKYSKMKVWRSIIGLMYLKKIKLE